ncbi:hypothetical protein X801_08849, partial [Opisthorchis viverrini]
MRGVYYRYTNFDQSADEAAFFLALDDEERDLDSDVNEDLSYLSKTFLTGNCYNRWFDKSFTLIVLPNSS